MLCPSDSSLEYKGIASGSKDRVVHRERSHCRSKQKEVEVREFAESGRNHAHYRFSNKTKTKRAMYGFSWSLTLGNRH